MNNRIGRIGHLVPVHMLYLSMNWFFLRNFI